MSDWGVAMQLLVRLMQMSSPKGLPLSTRRGYHSVLGGGHNSKTMVVGVVHLVSSVGATMRDSMLWVLGQNTTAGRGYEVLSAGNNAHHSFQFVQARARVCMYMYLELVVFVSYSRG